MDSRAKSKSEKSLCETSMKVVSNIIRVSSFSLAQRTLGTTGKASKEVMSEEDMVTEKEPLMVPEFRGSRRSQEPQSKPNPTYMIKPGGRDEPTAMSHRVLHHEKVHTKPKKEECVDGLASDYIKKIRNQIGCGL